jgi:hypothetical protein
VLPEPVEEELQGIAALGIREKQVRIDPVGMRQKVRTRIFSAAAGVVRWNSGK